VRQGKASQSWNKRVSVALRFSGIEKRVDRREREREGERERERKRER